MTTRQRLVDGLLRLYPAAWRREYGVELADMLLRRPLTGRIIGDVIWGGLTERVRRADPAVLGGTTMMLLVLSGLVLNVTNPSSATHGVARVLEDSAKTLPTVIVAPMVTELPLPYVSLPNLYAMALIGCGWWTYRRSGSMQQSGRAALRLSFIAGLPILVAGVLMIAGVLHLRVVGPGDALTSQPELTYTYFTIHQQTPSPLAILTAPLFRLPESWIWGLTGGWIARAVARRTQAQAA